MLESAAFEAMRYRAQPLPAIAWNTFREVARHPAYLLVVAGFALFISSSYWLSDFHFRRDVTAEVLQMGVASMLDCALFVAILGSSRVIYDEIEKKTVLTILAKPVGRGTFLLGKYMGLLLSVTAAILFLWGILIVTVQVHLASVDSTKVADLGMGEATDLASRGAALALLEAAILTAVAVAASIWFAFEVTAVSLLAFFFLGLMSERIGSYFAEQGWTWIGKGIYYLVPNLEDFSIDRAIATEKAVSNAYLGWATGYAVAVTVAILSVALALFRERELA